MRRKRPRNRYLERLTALKYMYLLQRDGVLCLMTITPVSRELWEDAGEHIAALVTRMIDNAMWLQVRRVTVPITIDVQPYTTSEMPHRNMIVVQAIGIVKRRAA